MYVQQRYERITEISHAHDFFKEVYLIFKHKI